MRDFLASAMAIAMALCISVAVVALGSVNQDLAVITYGLALLLALAWAGKLFVAKVVSWKHSPVHWPVLGFFLYALGRYFTSPIEYDSRLELLNVGLYTLVYFLCAANFYRSRDRTILLIALMVLALGESIYGFWQFFTHADTVLTFSRPKSYHGRASGTYICPNHFAGFIEMVVVLLITRIAMWNPSRQKVERLALMKVPIAYVALVAICAQLLSMSRASWVATAAGLVTLVMWGSLEWRRLWPRLVGAAVGLCVLGVLAFKLPAVRHYVALTFNEPAEAKSLALADTTLGSRTIMWGDTTQMISDYPLFGTGPATWQWFHPQYQPKEMQVYAELAHNDILNLTSDYGIIGAVLLLWAILAFFRHAAAFVGPKNGSDHRSFAIGSAVALTVILVHSWFDFNLHIPANALLLTTLIGFTVAMEDGADRYPRVELNRKGRIALGVLLLAIIGVGGWCAGRTAVAYYYQVQAKRNKSNLYWKTALQLYDRAISWDPKAPTPHARIGDIHRLQSFWRVGPTRRAEREQLARQAVEAYQKSLQFNPRQVEVWLGLAKSFGLAGEPERAEEAYQKAITLSPTTAYLHQEMGLFYRQRGDDAKAKLALEKATQLAWDKVAILNLQELNTP